MFSQIRRALPPHPQPQQSKIHHGTGAHQQDEPKQVKALQNGKGERKCIERIHFVVSYAPSRASYNWGNRRNMFRLAGLALFPVIAFAAKPPEWHRAHDLFQRTEYQQSLDVLKAVSGKDSDTLLLMGQDHFMLGEYKRATEELDKALALGNPTAQLYMWLGRAYGRRAETSSPFTAPGHASHAQKMFEKAVELDISNKDAVGDLFDYYMGAPGFLGGGLNKAEDLARKVSVRDPAEGFYLKAQIDEKRKQYDAAEQSLRRALELTPKQVGRILDLAHYLSKRGRAKESDALFEQATNMAPENPQVLFVRAESYIEARRNLEDARKLLEKYLRCPLTPDDPPRERAQELLAKARP
jgi:tetratricopeptide (TPR) repeat protein